MDRAHDVCYSRRRVGADLKAIVCGRCADIRALPSIEPLDEWVICRCGNVAGRWLDPTRGTMEVRAESRPDAYVLGLNNHMLSPLLAGEARSHAEKRALHDRATDAPNHIFDMTRAACWAVVFPVGATNDVTWAAENVAVSAVVKVWDPKWLPEGQTGFYAECSSPCREVWQRRDTREQAQADADIHNARLHPEALR